MRTDLHRNPTAFTTDLAHEAGLELNVDYAVGEPFVVGSGTYYTAKILADPIGVTIKLINKVGFYTHRGQQRWTYIAIPMFVWNLLLLPVKRAVIGFMYQHEGGTEMKEMF